MKISVDRSLCTGLGVCESLAPGYFEIDEDGDLVVRKEEIADADADAVDHAVAGCPTEALRIIP